MDESLHPFRIETPQEQLDDLADRLDRTRWPALSPAPGWEQGIPQRYLRELAGYWRHSYDWRAQERLLNSHPQFRTEIDGTTVHLMHVRSPEPDAFPLLITHGWPGSVAEFLKVIGPLTNPRAHGGDPADAFHLVLPAIPGYGYSGPPPDGGWTVERIGLAWGTLMSRLGYQRYGAQGGDWGSGISEQVGRLHPDAVAGVHLNMMITPPPDDPGELSEQEQERVRTLRHYRDELSGYARIQSTRPDTLSYGLTDSPIGQLAWVAEKFFEWTDSATAPEDAVDRDQLLTNVMIYWLTGTAGSSARLYRESWGGARSPVSSTVPTGVAVFPGDISQPVRRWAERTRNVVHWSEFERGGHFAAMEQPEALVRDIRLFFHGLR